MIETWIEKAADEIGDAFWEMFNTGEGSVDLEAIISRHAVADPMLAFLRSWHADDAGQPCATPSPLRALIGDYERLLVCIDTARGDWLDGDVADVGEMFRQMADPDPAATVAVIRQCRELADAIEGAK